MNDSLAMLKIKKLLNGACSGVLATQMKDQPYANLVAILPYQECRSIIFATPRATKKYANLKKHPKASILVDNRMNNASDFAVSNCCTACGQASEINNGAELQEVRAAFIARHPALKDFINNPDTAIFALKVTVYYFVENFQEVIEVHFPVQK